jgi:cation diffusion facilitator CzcD-associated flavoprotein CzcO
VRVVIVGAGLGGICTAIQLDRAGVEDLVVLERGARVGGVWNRNTYPGAACDVVSALYSYSFAPSPRWDRRFATQPVIQRYVEDTARRFGVLDRVRCGVDVRAARWDAEAARWHLDTSAGPETCDVLVMACGQLSRPALPQVPGIDRFAGPAFHSADWRHDLDLTGLRVGVLGTGASAIQFVPAIQPRVRSLVVVQRTPPWVLPKFDRGYAPRHERLFARVPALQTATRFGWWAFMEGAIAGFVGHDRLMRPMEALAAAQRRVQVRDPSLRRKVTPHYRIGCKRILLTNDWYRALTKRNVELVTDAVREVDEEGLVLADGSRRDLDVLIFGTGFHARTFVAPLAVTGRDGVTLEEVWGEVPHAWHGISVPGFPNAFLVYGPNTYGGSGSAVYMLESQARHVTKAIGRLRASGGTTIEVRRDAHEAFLRDLRARQERTIWATGGCTSWYLDEQGRDPTNWPGYTVDYRRRVRDVGPGVYALA